MILHAAKAKFRCVRRSSCVMSSPLMRKVVRTIRKIPLGIGVQKGYEISLSARIETRKYES